MPRPRKLWRIDELGDNRYLLIVSETQPDKNRLEKYGVAGTAGTKCYDDFIDRIVPGQCMRFRVVLNPVTAISNGKGNRASSHVCRTETEQRKYLADRSRINGFSVNDKDYIITNKGSVMLKKKEMKPAEFVRAAYEGVLTVTDKALFAKALKCGIGKHKAYGFGLITVIPIIK